MDATTEQLNRELRRMYAEYTDPREIEKRELREAEEKFINNQKSKAGL